MFDDLKNQPNNNSDNNTTPPAVVPNLPTTESSVVSSPSPQKSIVEDMLADSNEDSVKTSLHNIDMPVSSSNHSVGQAPPPVVPASTDDVPNLPDDPMAWSDNTSSTDTKKKMLIAGIVIVSAALLGVGGFIVYTKFFNTAESNPLLIDQTNTQATDTTQENTDNIDVADNTVPTADNNPDFVEPDNRIPIDSDGDGLTDAEEANYNTDPNLADTDRDGLFDREEIISWKTDPLNPDSDGDSYLDGDEIRNGYDPLGPGTLEYFDQLNF